MLSALTTMAIMGLSPRVRGNLSREKSSEPDVGSIPARAGEPTVPRYSPNPAGVYPRACGGTSKIRIVCHLAEGLSPRVRGNRVHPAGGPEHNGSIPARAGEPGADFALSTSSAVYPRACGGTAGVAHHGLSVVGLSPRVRGNRTAAWSRPPPRGSIPARAGEPHAAVCWRSRSRVYPRACGGTVSARAAAAVEAGLSPRVRGNPTDPATAIENNGSIPARAGEPRAVATSPVVARVYPRACGGTSEPSGPALVGRGLSPRVRGNRVGVGVGVGVGGSIPARAGEP